MNLYLRLLYVLFISWWQGPATFHEEQKLFFRTWPHDLDLNLHMNNGRYLTLMDLGRVQLMARLRMLGSILRFGWMPVIGEVHMKYRRSLSPFQAFELHTRIVSWDEKWFFIEQKFVSRGQLYAIAHVKGLFKKKGGSVPTEELLRRMQHKGPPPEPIPDFFQDKERKVD